MSVKADESISDNFVKAKTATEAAKKMKTAAFFVPWNGGFFCFETGAAMDAWMNSDKNPASPYYRREA